jgi:DNA-binding transcriptional LysR family regulator
VKHFDLNLLTALDALLQTGSVTTAAERMHLSTPAMSHTLARIRELLGDPVLVRAGRQLVPTPRALELAEPVRRLLDDAQALLEPSHVQGLDRVKRQFVIRAPDGMAVVFGAILAEELQAVMPQASLKFLPESHLDASGLREGRIDLDIGALRDKDPEIETVPLYDQVLVGAAQRGHPLFAAKVTAKRFAAERHVLIAARNNEPLPIDEALARLGLQRFVALTVTNSYAALIAASRSSLVACVPARMAYGMAPVLDLGVFELPFKLQSDPVVLAWHPRQAADPAHRWLRECAQRVVNQTEWKPPALGPMAERR